jgi:hypothetical protein
MSVDLPLPRAPVRTTMGLGAGSRGCLAQNDAQITYTRLSMGASAKSRSSLRRDEDSARGQRGTTRRGIERTAARRHRRLEQMRLLACL